MTVTLYILYMSLVDMERVYDDFQTRRGGVDAYPPEVLVGIGGISAALHPLVAHRWRFAEVVGLHETPREILLSKRKITSRDQEGITYAIGVPEDDNGNPYSNLHADLIGLRGLYRLRVEHGHRTRSRVATAEKEVQGTSLFAALLKVGIGSQREVAKTLGISEQTVSRWATGLTRPSSQDFEALGQLTGLTGEETALLASIPLRDAAQIVLDTKAIERLAAEADSDKPEETLEGKLLALIDEMGDTHPTLLDYVFTLTPTEQEKAIQEIQTLK